MTNVNLTHDQLVQLHDLFSARVAQLDEEIRNWTRLDEVLACEVAKLHKQEVKNLMQVFFGTDAVAA